jgi:imidazolonepropionase-like amidohydrolase
VPEEFPPGDSVPILHHELEDLVTHAALTPTEAITSATRNAAEVLDIVADIGTVERGRIADLLVLAADPAADIRCGAVHGRNPMLPTARQLQRHVR